MDKIGEIKDCIGVQFKNRERNMSLALEEVKESWEEVVKEYVRMRIGLDRVCLLIDAKWGMKVVDHKLINLMERSKTKYQIVLTKIDLVFPIDVARCVMQI